MCKRTAFTTLPWALERNREDATEDEISEEELLKKHLGAWESSTLGNISELFPLVPRIHSLIKEAKLDEAEKHAWQLFEGYRAVSRTMSGFDHLGVQALLDLSEITYLRNKNDNHEHAVEFQAINQNLSTAEELAKSSYERMSVLWCRAFIAGKYWRKDFAKHKESLLQSFCQFLEMELRLGPASKNRIELLDQVTELFQVIQMMYIDLDEDWNALLWAERERTRDFLLRVFENGTQGAYDFKSFDNDKDEEKGLQEIDSILKTVGSDTAFLVLSIGIKNRIISYCVNEESISRFVLPSEDMFDYLERTRNAIIKRKEEEDLDHDLSVLYGIFISPHEGWLQKKEIKRLIVVPAKEISWLPFSAFKYPGQSAFNESTGEMKLELDKCEDGDYLIEKFQIAVVPSLRVFGFCKNRYKALLANKKTDNDSPSPTKVGLVVGNPTSNLSRAQNEARAIKTTLESLGFEEVMHLEKEQATREKVAESLRSCAWVHFATHAEVNEMYPEGAIILANEDGATTQGLQFVRLPAAVIASEVMLNAKAVVLSCCESGLGEIHAKGILGLPRAFHIAGVPACVASFWKVSDKENLSAGEDVAEAMQNAVKFMIYSEDDSGNRIYNVTAWAAFFVSGNPSVKLLW